MDQMENDSITDTNSGKTDHFTFVLIDRLLPPPSQKLFVLLMTFVFACLIIEEQSNQSEGSESNIRPSLSQVKKSWGFRRTTIARREFLDEVGELAHSPPLLRRGRSRRACQTPQPTVEPSATQQATPATKSVIDDLEWSAPSSPVAEEQKPASEAFTGGSLDPSLWQDFGSAFHTAFSLLGGNEGLSLGMPEALPVPDIVEATDATEPSPPQAPEESEMPDNIETADDMEISQAVAADIAAQGEISDVVVISGQEDSDELTLIQIKEQLSSKNSLEDTGARGGKAGKGKARRKGRRQNRRKGKGRGRGRGRAAELQSSNVDDEEDDDEDVILVDPTEKQLQEVKQNDPHGPADTDTSSAHLNISLTPQHSSSDCICIESDLDQVTDATTGQFENAPTEQVEEEKDNKDNIKKGARPGTLDSKGHDSDALYCICRRKQNNRYTFISCNKLSRALEI